MAVHEGTRCPPAAWSPPAWLLPHQPAAARALVSALAIHGTALLADATGLGKTWTALAVATRYRRVVAVVPAMLRGQWCRTAGRTGVPIGLVTHEALSRGAVSPIADLILVDEAHRFRNPATRRYDRLARAIRGARVLLLTATPVVNRPDDLWHLLRLGMPRPPRDLDELMVARTPVEAGVAGMPAVGHSHRPHLVPARDILQGIAALTFPSFGPASADLLRQHLLYRLGSSHAAARETLRRHDRYLERLATEPLTRGAFRRLLDPDDPQLELSFSPKAAHRADIVAEQIRIAELRRLLASHPDRKVLDVASLLREPRGRTVVFTAAEATARAVATQLRWRRVALVTGRGGQIASGPVSVAAALDAFAPMARGVRVADAERTDILVATDLASEGLDLQDADMVVHFDIPWTPQRLMQRLGRVARLGSPHDEVRVVWYAPPARLELPHRLSRKARALDAVLRHRRLDIVPPPTRTRELARRVLRAARLAARDRNVMLLEVLDGVLAHLRDGLVVGAERELGEMIRDEVTARALRQWLSRWRVEG